MENLKTQDPNLSGVEQFENMAVANEVMITTLKTSIWHYVCEFCDARNVLTIKDWLRKDLETKKLFMVKRTDDCCYACGAIYEVLRRCELN
jgi:hypothetical protein